MINRILDFYLADLQAKGIKYDDIFVDNEYNRIANLIYGTNLPQVSITSNYININKLPSSTKNLYNNFEDYCYSYKNVFITVSDYSIVKPVVKMLIEKLYKRCLVEDVTIPSLLYVDVECLVSDLGKLIDVSNGKIDFESIAQSLQYSKDIIYRKIYTAKYVFWDKFDFAYGTYFNNYMYDIIKNRYNNCLSNMFFSDVQMENLIMNTKIKNLKEVLNVGWNMLMTTEHNKIQMIGGNE